MEPSDFRHEYEKLTDEEILRIWADKEGVTEIALSVLTKDMRRRKLLDNPLAEVRVKELKRGLAENRRRLERAQRRVIRRVQVLVIAPVVAAIVAIVMWVFFQK